MKKNLIKNIIFVGVIVVYVVFCCIQTPITSAVTMTGTGEEQVAVGSMWSLLPPIIAIGLALITKEVYSSLFIGIISGAVIGAIALGTGFEGVMTTVVGDGLIANIADSYNVGILIFLVVLGAIVVLMNRAGGSRAYGEWAAKHIKTRVGAGIATFILGVLIFVGRFGNASRHGQAQGFALKARLPHRRDRGSRLHHRPDLILGGGGQRNR